MVGTGKHALESARTAASVVAKLEHMERARTAFSEALSLFPGDSVARDFLTRSTDQLCTLLWDAGESARRANLMDTAVRCYAQLFELQPDNSHASARLAEIESRRQDLIRTSRLLLDDGRLTKAKDRLTTAAHLFPTDQVIASLLAECIRRVEQVETIIQDIPRHRQERSFCKLSDSVRELQASGVSVHGLDELAGQIERRLKQAKPIVESAQQKLGQKAWFSAIQQAEQALEIVSDHVEAQAIAKAASAAIEDVRTKLADAGNAMGARRPFLARTHLSDIESETIRDCVELKQLTDQVTASIRRANNFLRLIVWTFVGCVIWIMVGGIAARFQIGIEQAILTRVPANPILPKEAISLSVLVAAHFLFGALILGALSGALSRRFSVKTLAHCAVLATVLAVTVGLVLSLAGTRLLSPDDWFQQVFPTPKSAAGSLVFLLVALPVGASAGFLITTAASALIERTTTVPDVGASRLHANRDVRRRLQVALAAGAATASVAGLSGPWPLDMAPEIPSALVIGGLLAAFGIATTWFAKGTKRQGSDIHSYSRYHV
jgi:tetratricopeptide (TPR) repeat protein